MSFPTLDKQLPKLPQCHECRSSHRLIMTLRDFPHAGPMFPQRLLNLDGFTGST